MNIIYFGNGHLDNGYTGTDGGSSIRLPLIHELMKRGHTIDWVGFETPSPIHNNYLDLLNIYKKDHFFSVRRNSKLADCSKMRVDQFSFHNSTLIFIELRPNQDKPGHNFKAEFEKQIELIKKGIETNTQIVCWDQDGWSQDIPKELRDHILLLKPYCTTAPGFKRQKEFHYFVSTDYIKNAPKRERILDISYCGNVYNRRDEFFNAITPFNDEHKKVVVTGNWLKKDDETRKLCLDSFNNICWIGQTEHWSTIPLLQSAKATIHVSNEKHKRLGIISARIFEAVMADTPIFCTEELTGINKILPKELLCYESEILELSGSSSFDKFNSLDSLDIVDDYTKIREEFSVEKAVDRLFK